MRIPGPKWGAGRPPLETPKSRCAIRIGRTPRRLRGWSFGAVGESRERVRARHGRRTSTASFGGFAPLPPCVPQRERLPVMRDMRMVPRPKRLLRRSLRKSPGSSCRAAARSSVTPLARLWPQATLARPPAGESQRGRSPLWPVFAYFLLAQKVGARRGLSASKGKIRNLRRHKRDNKRLPERKPALAACEVPRRGKRVKGKIKNFKQTQRG